MSDWKTVKLGDVCQINNGGTPDSKNKVYWGGDVQWLTPKDMGKLNNRYIKVTDRQINKDGLNNSSAKLIPENSVILSSRAPIGHLAINFVPMSFNQGCRGLVPNSELLTEFLYYFLFSSKQLLNDLGTGTTFKEISNKTLSNVKIPLPSLAEQKRIVAKLDAAFTEIDTAITATEKKQEEVNKLKQAILTNTLQPSKSSAVELLENVCEIQPKKAEIKEQLSNDINVSFMGMNLLRIEKKIATTIVEKPLASVYKNYTYFANNDVLLAKITPCFENGKIGIAQKLKNGVGFGSSEFVVFRCRDKLIPEYLYYFLNQKHFREKGKKNMSGAVGHKRLTKEFINKTLIPLPTLPEQKRIVAKLDTAFTEIDNFTQATKKKIANHKALKSALLTQELQPQK